MKIELKKIEFSEGMSEETNCFVANLYINGKNVGTAKNDGQGGCTDIRGNSKEDYKVIREAEEYCKTLPKIKFSWGEMEQDLESVVNNLLEENLLAKEKKKFEKRMVNAILFGVPKAGSYSMIKFNVPLSKIPKPTLQKKVDDIVKTYCNDDGVVILNTNLEALGITF